MTRKDVALASDEKSEIIRRSNENKSGIRKKFSCNNQKETSSVQLYTIQSRSQKDQIIHTAYIESRIQVLQEWQEEKRSLTNINREK